MLWAQFTLPGSSRSHRHPDEAQGGMLLPARQERSRTAPAEPRGIRWYLSPKHSLLREILQRACCDVGARLWRWN